MKLKNLGKSTSHVEILNISQFGFWLYTNETEYFLPYADFPWFKDATISEIQDVKLLHKNHLYWETLDIDLCLCSLTNLEKYSLIYK